LLHLLLLGTAITLCTKNYDCEKEALCIYCSFQLWRAFLLSGSSNFVIIFQRCVRAAFRVCREFTLLYAYLPQQKKPGFLPGFLFFNERVDYLDCRMATS
jgi:hypothetical protein